MNAIRSIASIVLSALMSCCLAQAAQAATLLQKIETGKVIRVAVPGDYAPYGSVGPDMQALDWRDEINGVREGLSRTLRRASEMPHIGEIFQIGLRAQGSGRQEDYDAAVA